MNDLATLDTQPLSPARRELLNWIISNEEKRKNKGRIAAMKAAQNCDGPIATPGITAETVRKKKTHNIIYKIASSRKEREAAFRLVYQSYLRSGLCQPNDLGIRVTPYHLLPTTEIYVACLENTVISTLTLIADSDQGLPLDSIYRKEVDALRRQGLYLGEVSCFADRRHDIRRFLMVFMKLARFMVQTARERGMAGTLIVVHPKHADFYARSLGFVRMGEEKLYPTVQNRPGVALYLDFARIDRERAEDYNRLFGEQIPQDELRPQPIPPEEYEHFGRMVVASDHPPVRQTELAGVPGTQSRGERRP